MGVEYHLLRLSRIGSDKEHPAMTEPDMRHLHKGCHSANDHNLVIPIELVRLAGGKTQRHKGLRRDGAALLGPGLRIAPHRIVAAVIALATQLLEHPNQRQPFPPSLDLLPGSKRSRAPTHGPSFGNGWAVRS